MEIGVYGPILTQKNIKGSMGQLYPYSTKWVKNIVVIIHIYGATAILLLFCYHQDTEPESWEMDTGVSVTMFTPPKNICSMWKQYS